MPNDSLIAPIVSAVVGAIIGSFVALVANRLPRGAPVVLARSCCDSCRRPLRPVELVPLLSFVAQRGRCTTCRASIGWRSPAIELAAAVIGVASTLALPGAAGIAAAVLGWALLLLGLLDAGYFWLPSAITLPLAATGLLAAVVIDPTAIADHVIGATAGYAILAGAAALYRRVRGRDGLGGGDAKLFAASGAWLGWAALPLVLTAAAVAGLVVALVVWRGRVTATTRLPFGVFLGAATWVVYLAGG